MAGRLRGAAPYLALIATTVWFYVLAQRLEFDGSGDRIGPGAWPKIILGLMLAAALYGAGKALLGANVRSDGFIVDPTTPLDDSDSAPQQSWLHLALAGIALFVGYTLALGPLGFLVATALLLALFMLVGRYRNYAVIAAASLGGSLFFFFIFKKVVYLSLPLGQGPFLSVSVAIMKLIGAN